MARRPPPKPEPPMGPVGQVRSIRGACIKHNKPILARRIKEAARCAKAARDEQ
jgi:hypothetical protein